MSVMIIGTISMGRIEHVAGCSIATRFLMINGMPLAPRGSYIDLGPLNGTAIPIPSSTRSIAAGMLRPWLTVAAGLLFAAAAWKPLMLAAALPLAVLAAYLWLAFGRLSPAQKRMRLAYATWLGAPFDPAHLPPEMEIPHAGALRTFVDERAAQAPVDYRAQRLEPWRAVAAESDDPDLLVAALTRARVDRIGADAADQVQLDALHAAIWSKLDPLLRVGRAPRALQDWQARLADEERRRASPTLIAAVLAGLAVFGGVSLLAMMYTLRPTLAVVNATPADGLTVLLDGEPVARSIPAAHREDDGGFRFVRLKSGAHELVARDASGKEIDRRRFALKDGEHADFLYVPARSAQVCFFHQRMSYSTQESMRSNEVLPLDPAESFFAFRGTIDFWFREPPGSIERSQQSVVTEKRAIRAAACAPPRAP
jgi:hypothetical protein